MPDVRIQDLGQLDALQNNDYLVIGSGNDTYKTTVQAIKAAISPSVLYKQITTPGIYQAKDEGVYGYSGVNVSIDSVSGVKGGAELDFRSGYVSISPEDVGLSIATIADTKAYFGLT